MLTVPSLASLMPQLANQVSQLKDFLSYLSTVKGDLSSITAPPFILAPYSAVEVPSHWAAHQSSFLQPTEEDDPSQRALLVLKNYLLSLKGVTGYGTEHEARKPVNPFLGELFVGMWDPSKTKLFVEQVSHHPPVTACCITNKERGISSSGFVRQETSFSATSGITVQQHGYALIKDEKHSETHLMTMPILKIQGLALANPYVELAGDAYIASSSGYVTKIDFEGTGKLGLGKKHKVLATVTNVNDPKKVIWSVLGQWTGKLSVKDAHNRVVSEFSADDHTATPLNVQEVEQQSDVESRKAWRYVFDGIKSGDVTMVNKHKTALEETQRNLRTSEKQGEQQWQSKLFAKRDDDPAARRLLGMIPDKTVSGFDGSKTGGFWSFRGEDDGESLIRDLRRKSRE